MTRNAKCAIVFVIVLLEIAVVITTGVPVRWTKGVVVSDACQPMGETYSCKVELVSYGSRATAQSDCTMAPGRSVKLRGWLDVTPGNFSYTVVNLDLRACFDSNMVAVKCQRADQPRPDRQSRPSQ